MTPLHRAWTDGVIQGLREYAWMEDGIQYVGKPHTYKCRPLVEAERLAEHVWADNGTPAMATCIDCGITVVPYDGETKLCYRCMFRRELG